MKKNMLPIMVPCLVVCVLAFLDVDYARLTALDVVSMVCAGAALGAMAVYWFRNRT